jgi:hypothetical protein
LAVLIILREVLRGNPGRVQSRLTVGKNDHPPLR